MLPKAARRQSVPSPRRRRRRSLLFCLVSHQPPILDGGWHFQQTAVRQDRNVECNCIERFWILEGRRDESGFVSDSFNFAQQGWLGILWRGNLAIAVYLSEPCS